MKKYIYILLALFIFSGLTACTENELAGSGEGTFSLDVQLGKKIVAVTNSRAVPSNEVLLANCKVTIVNSEGETAYSQTGTSGLSGVRLSAGTYTVTVEAGNKVAASFDDVYYKGEADFTVIADRSTPVNVTATIQNTLVQVIFGEDLKAAYSGYKVRAFTPSTLNSPLEYTQVKSGEEYDGYFTLINNESIIGWSFILDDYETAGEINAKPATRYTLTYTVDDEGDSGQTGAKVKLTVKEGPVETKEDEIPIYEQTKITGDGIDRPVEFRMGTIGNKVSFEVAASTPVKNIQIGNSTFFTAEEVVIPIPLSQVAAEELSDQGIQVEYEGNEPTIVKITLDDTLLDRVTETEGRFIFNISVTDSKDQITSADLTVYVIATVSPQVKEGEIWTNRATLRAVTSISIIEPVFFYRAVTLGRSEDGWVSVDGTRNAMELSAEITDLQPGTTYEYYVKVGEDISSRVRFKTEEAAQLPNSSFENWSTETNRVPPTYLTTKTYPTPNGAGDAKFWDTGNWGAAAATKELTTQSTEYVKTGSSSIKLASMEAKIANIGRFAAGNVFTGEFQSILYNIGGGGAAAAGGKLSFGREFTSRPTALKGWYKYTNGGAIKLDDKLGYMVEDMEGSPDQACVYIALSSKGEPFNIVNTTTTGLALSFFNKDDEDIIAYGEWNHEETTDTLDEFIINLEYKDKTRKPTHIIVVATSSKYGEFFCGAVGSTLWLDDLELIYE